MTSCIELGAGLVILVAAMAIITVVVGVMWMLWRKIDLKINSGD